MGRGEGGGCVSAVAMDFVREGVGTWWHKCSGDDSDNVVITASERPPGMVTVRAACPARFTGVGRVFDIARVAADFRENRGSCDRSGGTRATNRCGAAAPHGYTLKGKLPRGVGVDRPNAGTSRPADRDVDTSASPSIGPRGEAFDWARAGRRRCTFTDHLADARTPNSLAKLRVRVLAWSQSARKQLLRVLCFARARRPAPSPPTPHRASQPCCTAQYSSPASLARLLGPSPRPAAVHARARFALPALGTYNAICWRGGLTVRAVTRSLRDPNRHLLRSFALFSSVPSPSPPSIMGEEGYSFSLTTFSPSGKLLQIEHALRAVQAGKMALGIQGVSPGGAVSGAPTRFHSRACL